MEEYRWGVFLAERNPDRRIAFGEQKGRPVWQQVPGEYRADLQRLIVVQGDTEPASVEQQRRLGATAPSLYDLRNLFQVNVEEGRHLWAMVYLLHTYFGRGGREEADALLARHSGDVDSPRVLGAFNEETPDWLHDLRGEYIADCEHGLKRWNRVLEQAGIGRRLALPRVGFHRHVGLFAGHHVTPRGDVVGADVWEANRDSWLPSQADKAHVRSLMRPVYEPGKIAGWIAPPSNGINDKPFDYAYVHLPDRSRP